MKAIEFSIIPFPSPTVLVKMKNGTVRLYIDYMKLNSINKTSCSSTSSDWEYLRYTQWIQMFFFSLDLAMGYQQVKVHPDDQEKTAFSTPFYIIQYNVMPFWHANVPGTFMRLMTLLFSKTLYSTCLAYLDDIITFGRSFKKTPKPIRQCC